MIRAEEILTNHAPQFKELQGEFYRSTQAKLKINKAADYREKKCPKEALKLYFEVLKYYESIRKASLDLVDLHIHIGNCYRDVNKYELAKNTFEKAEGILINLDGDNTKLLQMGHIKAALACVYMNLSQSQDKQDLELLLKAKEYHKSALELFDQNEGGQYYKKIQLANWKALNNSYGNGTSVGKKRFALRLR